MLKGQKDTNMEFNLWISESGPQSWNSVGMWMPVLCQYWGVLVLLISLHIRSMWETICDAKASRKWQGKICTEIPHNTLFWNLVQNNTPPPRKLKFRQILDFGIWLTQNTPSPNWNLGRSWHFEFWLPEPPPPHPSVGWSMWRLIAVSPKDSI